MPEPASIEDEPWKIHGAEVKYLPTQAVAGVAHVKGRTAILCADGKRNKTEDLGGQCLWIGRRAIGEQVHHRLPYAGRVNKQYAAFVEWGLGHEPRHTLDDVGIAGTERKPLELADRQHWPGRSAVLKLV